MALGLAPLFLLVLIKWRPFDRLQTICGLLALVLAIIYGSYHAALSYSIVFHIYSVSYVLVLYGPFYVFEVAIYVFLLWRFSTSSQGHSCVDRRLLLIPALLLPLTGFIRFGLLNDFSLRLSMPALYILWVLLGRRLLFPPLSRRAAINYIATILAITIGSGTAINEFGRSLQRLPQLYFLPPLQSVRPTYSCESRAEVNSQYIGNARSGAPFFRYFAK